LVFEGIQQEIVLFLGEKSCGVHTGIRTIELEGVHELLTRGQDILHHTQLKEMDHSTEKWTMYFLDEDELDLLRWLRKHEQLTRAGHVIDVDVGIVTGLNEFFVLSEQQVEQYRLRPFTERLVGRSAQLSGAILTEQDWMNNVEKQFPAFLLHLPDVPFSQLPCELQSYIANGEAKGLHTGYKCRIRNHWYVVPSVWTPQAFMLRQIHQFP
ncbi:MAG TPA: SAM-dependent methyltransferase, partial [Ktedonobacter sp.]|nr:SAM-dependent methyltransferase [Ktedonobacter sp.]